jgi:hypothetical protein
MHNGRSLENFKQRPSHPIFCLVREWLLEGMSGSLEASQEATVMQGRDKETLSRRLGVRSGKVWDLYEVGMTGFADAFACRE